MLLDELEAEPKPTVAWLEQVSRRHAADRGFVRQLAEAVASGSPVLERGGAWLLRKHVDETGGYPSEAWAIAVDGLGGVTSWETRLVLCQMLAEHPGLFDAAPRDLADFLRACAGHKTPFVRAWAVTAFHALGQRHAAFRAQAKRLLVKARTDPAKSVQARLRHLK